MRRKPHNHLILISVLFWALAAGGLFVYLTQGNAAAESPETEAGQLVAQQCIENAFPVVSRGSAIRETSVKPAEDQEEAPQNDASPDSDGQEGREGLLRAMIDKSLPFLGVGVSKEEVLTGAAETSGEEGAAEGVQEKDTAAQGSMEGEDGAKQPEADDSEEKTAQQVPVIDTQESKKPLVLIYHTHATESYQPVTTGNFHSIPEEGTVREVGNVLAKALEEKGIPVIHDKTLHDNPSYNQSYGRSLQTAQNYLEKNPSIKIVIDLHRDAASYSGNVGKTANVNGNQAATYSLVIGKGNANVEKLRQFAQRIAEASDKLYPDLFSRVIEKEYRFNQYVCDQYLLLEVGNNENTIDQVKLTGTYFADIIEEYIKEYPQ